MEFMPWTMQPVTTVEIVPHAREEMDAMTVKTKCKEICHKRQWKCTWPVVH